MPIDQIQREHPGFYIKRELDARGWSQTDLAYILEMSPQQLNPVLAGKHGITPKMAVLLGAAFDFEPEVFTSLQMAFDLAQEAGADPGVKARAQWQSHYPLRQMIQRGWIMEMDASLLDVQMMRFFEVNRTEDIPFVGDGKHAGFAAKKTVADSTSPEELAWLYRVRQVAKTQSVPPYSESALRASIAELSTLRNLPDDVPLAIKLIMRCGVRVVMVETLPKAKIDGVCTWLDDAPVIGITNRHDRLDNFWFVIRHELEHVMCGHGKEGGAVIDGDETLSIDAVAEEERVANAAASEFCVSQRQLESLIARKGDYVSEKDILGFSKRMEIHPSIAVGQYQFRTKKWNFLRKYLASSVCGVRESLIPALREANAVDGWNITATAEL